MRQLIMDDDKLIILDEWKKIIDDEWKHKKIVLYAHFNGLVTAASTEYLFLLHFMHLYM